MSRIIHNYIYGEPTTQLLAGVLDQTITVEHLIVEANKELWVLDAPHLGDSKWFGQQQKLIF